MSKGLSQGDPPLHNPSLKMKGDQDYSDPAIAPCDPRQTTVAACQD